MPHQFSLNQTVRKPAVRSKGGIVAAQSRRAAEVGAEVLAAGGDCVDAIVATTMALNVLEPWNSGIGGGGAMVLYRARDNKVGLGAAVGIGSAALVAALLFTRRGTARRSRAS